MPEYGAGASSASADAAMTLASTGREAVHRPVGTQAVATKRFWGNIQLLRLIAAYCIVYIHLPALFGSIGGFPDLIAVLRFGTDLFVVIAGFLTAQVMTVSNKGGISYLKERIIRIIPLYALCTIAAFLAQNYLMKNHEIGISELLKSLTFIPYGEYPVLYPTWTLFLIVEFSVIVGLGFVISKKYGLYISSAAVVILAVAGPSTKFDSEPFIFYMNPIIIDFAMGVFIFMFITSGRAALLFGREALWLGAGIAGICAAAVIMRPIFWPFLPRLLALGVPAAGILLGTLICEISGAAVRSNAVNFLAKCTYAVYLCHWFVNVVAEKLVDISKNPVPVSILLLVVTPIVVSAVAIFVYLYIETPITKYLTALFAGKRSRPAQGNAGAAG